MSQVAMETFIQGPPLTVVEAHGLYLHQRAQHKENVEYLVALSNEVTPAREPALRVGVSEEVGTHQEEEDLVAVVGHGLVSATVLGAVAAVDAVQHGADV